MHLWASPFSKRLEVGSGSLRHIARPRMGATGNLPGAGSGLLTTRQEAPDKARCSRGPNHATHGTAIEFPMAL